MTGSDPVSDRRPNPHEMCPALDAEPIVCPVPTPTVVDGICATAAVITIVAAGAALLGGRPWPGRDGDVPCAEPGSLAPAPRAFAGTASVVDGEPVILDVTEWSPGATKPRWR